MRTLVPVDDFQKRARFWPITDCEAPVSQRILTETALDISLESDTEPS